MPLLPDLARDRGKIYISISTSKSVRTSTYKHTHTQNVIFAAESLKLFLLLGRGTFAGTLVPRHQRYTLKLHWNSLGMAEEARRGCRKCL